MTWYALATYRAKAGLRPAIVLEGQLYDLAATWRVSMQDTPPAWLDQPVAALLGSWANVGPELARLAAASHPRRGELTPCDSASLAAPFVPARIFGAASNYVEHANEMGTVLAAKAESQPYMFMKSSTSVIGPEQTVCIPPETQQADWEVELGVVIGSKARYVSEADAFKYVAGYCVVNDVSEREYQTERGGTWDKGKGCDTFGPVGPWMVTADEVSDPQQLAMWLEVNGKRFQNGSTATMIFGVAHLVAYISRFMTLYPGDLISTGTPPGVGMGKKPPLYLTAGVEMRLGIAGLGEQHQRVHAWDPQLIDD